MNISTFKSAVLAGALAFLMPLAPMPETSSFFTSLLQTQPQTSFFP